MKQKVRSFLVSRLLRDIREKPFMVIIQDGDQTRVYTRGLTEFPEDIQADLFLITERDMDGTPVAHV